MNIFSSKQVKIIDNYTINAEPIDSVNLMERASINCANWISHKYNTNSKILVFAGCGNNGGDGMAIARLLSNQNYHVELYLIRVNPTLSNDAQINLSRFQKTNPERFHEITHCSQLPNLNNTDIIVDAIFGSGLSRPLSGLALETIEYLNKSKCIKIAIDIPTGMPSEGIASNNGAFKANHTLTFQFPFLSFAFHENHPFIGQWQVLDIKLMIPDSEYPNIFFTDFNDIHLKERKEFSHKGSFGHALIMAGSKGMAGAAILSAKSCLMSGCGLVTCYVPSSISDLIQISFPEAIVKSDSNTNYLSTLPDLTKYKAIAIGPGIEQQILTEVVVRELLEISTVPLVIDADALNIISSNPDLLQKLPQNTIITPHPREFERLFGSSENSYECFLKQIRKAVDLKIIIVLKGRYTCIALPNGKAWFNTSGNNGMATGGSGDVLTGIITSLLAQGYEPSDAAITGVYIHGLAADIAVEKIAHESLIASNIINNISNAFIKIKSNTSNNND
jgi:hydroxyethylthiazole kinase-like uncharacterized protein yjeF